MRLCQLKSALLCFAAALLAAADTRPAAAAVIVGGSTLLNATSANQLETWLGEGPLVLTRIFAKQTGDDSFDFHAAVDGQGRTFSVIQVLETQNNFGYFQTSPTQRTVNIQQQIIGGYNPQSWSSTDGWHMTSTDAKRTAFLFNLSSNEIQLQNLNSQGNGGSGQFQSFNLSDQGSTFGGGHDIWVNNTLDAGYTFNYSFGGTSYLDNIVIGGGYLTHNLQYGQIEVFTIANAAAVTTPEPASLVAWSGFCLLGLAFRAARRRKHARDSLAPGSCNA